jgi:ribonuclease-3
MPEVTNFAELEVLLDQCQTALNYRFHDIELLAMCLTHASSARTRLHSNERLEFLGDTVLGLVVCEALYHRFPESSEGELTRIKSIVVSRATCATMAARVRLQEFVLVGKGLDHGGHIPSSILAGTFEGLIAGIYLDGGLEATREFLTPLITPEIESSAATLHEQNFKSLLQHIAQKKFGATPMYRLLDERGPDHSKVFHISVVVAGRIFPAAWGANKKEAEQTAAQHALEELLGEDAGADRNASPPDLREAEMSEAPASVLAAPVPIAASLQPEPFGLGVEQS